MRHPESVGTSIVGGLIFVGLIATLIFLPWII